MSSSSHSSVAGNFERLRLSSDNGMPVETRGMKAQRYGRPGPSATPGRLPSASTPGRSRRTARVPARTRAGEDDDPENIDDSDDSDNDDDDEPAQGRRPSVFWEVWSVYEPSSLTPRELARVGRSTTRYSEATYVSQNATTLT